MSTEKLHNILQIQTQNVMFHEQDNNQKRYYKAEKKRVFFFIGERRELFKEIEQELERYDFFKVKCFTH